MIDDFLNPDRLWLLVVVLGLAVAYVAVLRWRRAAAVRFTQIDLLDQVAPQRPGWRRHVVAGLQLCGLAIGVVAIARPVSTTTERTVSEGRIIVAFDVSLSMEATDVAPSRFAAAQEAARQFIDQVDTDIEIGLIPFSGTVSVAVQPTLQRSAVHRAIDGLELGPATAIGDALIVGTDLLLQLQGDEVEDPEAPAETPAPGAIVLLSDGFTTTGAATEEGAAYAAAAGVPVFTISFGTPDGVIVEGGNEIAVPISPEPLREAAVMTGGQAYEAATASELGDVYERIRELLGETLGEEFEVVTERTWEFAAVAIAVLAAAWALSLWWLRGMV